MEPFFEFSQPMGYSYSSASNDSVPPSIGQPMEMPSNDYALLYSSSADSNMSFGYLPSEQLDELGSSLSVDIQSWHDGGSVDYSEPDQPYGIPVPRPNSGYGAQFSMIPRSEITTSPTHLTPPHFHPHPQHPQYRPTESEKPVKQFSCNTCGKAFTRVADVKRHQTSVHFPVLEDCPMVPCQRKGKSGFPRKDHLVEHLRSFHHIDIPKRAVTKRKVVKNGPSLIMDDMLM